jgi:hypothetical protein
MAVTDPITTATDRRAVELAASWTLGDRTQHIDVAETLSALRDHQAVDPATIRGRPSRATYNATHNSTILMGT